MSVFDVIALAIIQDRVEFRIMPTCRVLTQRRELTALRKLLTRFAALRSSILSLSVKHRVHV